MSIHAALYHKTQYVYDRSVQMGPQVIRLRPAPHSRTPVLSYALKIEPEGYFLNWQQDAFGNYLARVVYPEKTTSFSVEVDLVADMSVYNPFDFFLEPEAEHFPFTYDDLTRRDLDPYLDLPQLGPKFSAWLDALPSFDGMHIVDMLVGLNQRLEQDIGYVVRMEPGIQTPDETLDRGTGSCRDSSWMLVLALRHLGLAARFVSGYLIQLEADVKALDGPTGTDKDFTDLHAWAEVYLPGAGWIGLDPTSGLLAGEGHIPLACSPNPSTAAPITGIVEDCETDFSFEMAITRIHESPRVTKPYTDDQWAAIDALGKQIDKDLNDQDVRLTIGGEPTFVAVDHPDDPEWNTDAVGPNKRDYADQLIRRLKDIYAPEGVLHFGQGKWYPGEQLPRWAFGLYWRKDGKPIWTSTELLAEEAKDYAPTTEQAEALLAGVAERLEIDAPAIMPAYEDPLHFVAQERKLPENLDPSTNKLEDPLARDRLARVFERGLDHPRGYVLPIQVWNDKERGRRWISEPWSTRSGNLFLIPGDSPIGFRLPLPSLPYVEPTEFPYVVEADPFSPDVDGELPDRDGRRQKFLNRSRDDHPDREQQRGQSAVGGGGQYVRAAMSVEPRDGRLCVFMPPVEQAADYLDLLTAIEDTAAELETSVLLEGYTPPQDARLNMIKVTPDPGVIEVNIHPNSSWDEMVATTETLYEQAHLCRLGTEKFMVDGRHSGTGGGNHLVVGAATPIDSPFLRRPDLLKSLVAYWQNHPALSYLFSGMFIGPTSQAPRVDEARHDTLYELELAFQQIPDPSSRETVEPWLVDRIFRNLLIDVTGNTHRAEICIDKLYSPDGPTGRLGLVEFRAFEMPPHARMSLAQQLLLMGLIARFWSAPYDNGLVRWGTQLNDRFMLPHYVWQDLLSVVQEMQRAGYDVDPAWFAPHFEFRFPLYGSVTFEGIELELRQALEPWHVMGEEGAAGGTVRYVDSSVERLQVKVSGLPGDRYQIGCNGKRVPLQATGTAGEAVAGVRFRAWQPAASLHPTIGVDHPLVFDIYDTWTKRAVAGCTYHVAHPGGRNYETAPVNDYEAESRRLARFFAEGHSTGEANPPAELSQPEFPHTLDLRWA